uniref:Uncharacterized protein n=1 Tax=Davidia involucrata TaxID=16924 RepID=A0A5B6Z6N5_DAVIN
MGREEDWSSSIPDDLLKLIVKRIHSIEDYLMFRAVCRSWNSIPCGVNDFDSSMKLPWLMLTEKENSDTRGFYSLSGRKIHELYLPEARGRRCWGSPYGWLITIGTDLCMNLLNPLSRVSISLPHQSTFTDQYRGFSSPEFLRTYFIEKAVLSSSPSPSRGGDCCFVIALYSQFRKLAIAKPGDDAWSPVEAPWGAFEDVACLDGKVFALNCVGDLHLLLICGEFTAHPKAKAVHFAGPPPDGEPSCKKYIVGLNGELYVVYRFHDETEGGDYVLTSDFEIYKLNMQTREWKEVSGGLGDDWTLFLGNNYSLPIRASEECRSNCIYFTDDFLEYYPKSEGRDMGIYNCKDETVDRIPVHVVSSHLFSPFCPPLWITPNPC